jgi:hypothetical protein
MNHLEEPSLSSSPTAVKSFTVPYNIEQRQAVVYLYNVIGNDKNALNIIRSFDGFENLNGKKLKRWMKQPVPKPTGRPISEEFEQEVLAECEKSAASNKKKVSSTANKYPYSFVRECAASVFDREYWDENDFSFVKKWHMDPRTSKLQLTNKWVVGLLRRDLKKSADTSLTAAALAVEKVHEALVAEKAPIGTSSINTPGVITTADPVVMNKDSSDAIVPVLGIDLDLNDFDFDRLFEDFDSHHRITSASSSNLHPEDFKKLLEMDIDWSTEFITT